MAFELATRTNEQRIAPFIVVSHWKAFELNSMRNSMSEREKFDCLAEAEAEAAWLWLAFARGLGKRSLKRNTGSQMNFTPN